MMTLLFKMPKSMQETLYTWCSSLNEDIFIQDLVLIEERIYH